MKKVILSAIIIVTMLVLVVGLEFVINNNIGQSISSELKSSELISDKSSTLYLERENLIILGSSIEIISKKELNEETTMLRRAGNRFIDVNNPQNVYTFNEVQEISQNQGILNNQRVIII